MPNKLSIITINRDNAEGLQKTIESVAGQTINCFEFIVIDGASTDSSVEVIKQYADKINYWVSEPDKGIFNAMNKGILKACGEYLLFLNSGDWFVDKNIVADFYNLNCDEDIISGNVFVLNHGNEYLHKTVEIEDLNYGLFYEGSIPHPSTFIKRKLFADYGNYTESFKIVSDWEFFFKVLIQNECSYKYFNRIISYFDLTGISNSIEWRLVQEKEREMVLQNYLPFVYKSYKRIYEENTQLRMHEIEYREYMNLKNGKAAFVVKIILFFKRIIR